MNTRIPPTWKQSTSPRKQRKWRAQAPLHARHVLMGAPVIKTLREKIQKRSLPLRKGDKVKILRGQFRGKIGVVLKVNTKRYRVFVEGVELVRKNGGKVPYGLHPSKVMIIELHEDKRRIKQREKKEKKAEAKKTEKVDKNG